MRACLRSLGDRVVRRRRARRLDRVMRKLDGVYDDIRRLSEQLAGADERKTVKRALAELASAKITLVIAKRFPDVHPDDVG